MYLSQITETEKQKRTVFVKLEIKLLAQYLTHGRTNSVPSLFPHFLSLARLSGHSILRPWQLTPNAMQYVDKRDCSRENHENLFLEKGFHFVAKAGLNLKILLPQLPGCLHHR